MTFLTPARLIAPLVAIGLLALVWLLLPGPPGRSATLDLGEPIGSVTHRRLAGLGESGACRAALDRAGIAYRAIPPRTAPDTCAFDDGIAWRPGGAREALYAPTAPALACPLAAGLALWEWDIVQPAAASLLGSPVVRIDHFGSFACRRIYGRESGAWSRHARAQAIDVAGFRLADGRQITIAADWKGETPESRFLHRVRDGGCRVFGTTLSPDYNDAHRDHLHLDEGGTVWSLCR
ncbi:extensin family protein [Sphingomonas sp. BIUV-7]|uniref:Extensin family protein n=1 Tax=Sphingomonas natans TaxID=3063330 RepID=A0ABT8Y7M7_9SPHN|nr:extensin family protein [Sphingomonas sp. BIUV-7]MDO6413700.1 extensin family protein [Sphingomonas sp. BIUV-7]